MACTGCGAEFRLPLLGRFIELVHLERGVEIGGRGMLLAAREVSPAGANQPHTIEDFVLDLRIPATQNIQGSVTPQV